MREHECDWCESPLISALAAGVWLAFVLALVTLPAWLGPWLDGP